MTHALEIAKGERGLVRVFALSMDDAASQRLARATQDLPDGKAGLAHLLGLPTLDPRYVEIFAVADIEELGLPAFLTEGKGVTPSAISDDCARLAGLDGWVAIVASAAFDDEAVARLTPDPRITLIGTYPEDGVDWTPVPVQTDSANPFSGAGTEVKSAKTSAPRGLTWAMITLSAVLFVIYFARQGT